MLEHPGLDSRTACRTSLQRLTGFTVVALLALAVHTARGATPGQQPSRLLYAEPLSTQWEGLVAAHSGASTGPAPEIVRFRALGQDFQLVLLQNEQLGPAPGSITLYTGTVSGARGSWVRLTREGDDLIGLIYDGAEYFGIEPVASLVVVLDPDVPQPGAGNMIYRLADLLIDPGLLACGTGEPVAPARSGAEGSWVSAAAATRALTTELAAAQTGPGYRLHVAPTADFEFASRFGSNAASEMLARLNIADGIFSTQAGVHLVADEPVIFTSTATPYPFSAAAAAELLTQASDYRLASGTSAGLTHLFTNKTFPGNVAGIAWMGSVCVARTGASLSTSAGISSVTSGLVAAHEIGHNLGAPHDGEAGSACESTAQDFLMAPRANGSSTLSPCGLGRIASVVSQRAGSYPACLVAISNPPASNPPITNSDGSPAPDGDGGGGGGTTDLLTLIGLLALALGRPLRKLCIPV